MLRGTSRKISGELLALLPNLFVFWCDTKIHELPPFFMNTDCDVFPAEP
jgi:hypothetical protein